MEYKGEVVSLFEYLNMKYFKRYWEEVRVEDDKNWGKSVWYFETDNNGLPIRQVEEYENGIVLKYNSKMNKDKFGMLADQELDLEEFSEFKIIKSEFDKVWE